MDIAHILLVEDNEGDILLTQEAFRERKIVNKLSVVRNGGDAVDFLFKEGQFAEAERPDLILLDLNLPVKSGIEVLQMLKSRKETRKIPIIVLTTSSSQKDIDKAYFHHANSYITKPLDLEEFMQAIFKIEEFWIQLIKHPE
ncbi:MAG: response regulator [Sediminicola sp.]|tara:strand:+ start:12680 stop:13105 length:426 start_codon:yes stop_codon:yes gene_type:complete